jgi:hypothetical protein
MSTPAQYLRARMANSPEWVQKMKNAYVALPEFVREDLLEGLLVGGGIALPVAMMGQQDPHEQAAAILGGITAATLGGAASRRIGAKIGGKINPGELQPGSYGYNMGRVMGREDVLVDTLKDITGMAPEPRITGAEFGRAIGRAVGDEAFGIGGTLGALALAQAMDSTPDEKPQPTIGEVAWGTIPGAAIGLAASGLAGGMIDTVGLNRAQMIGNDPQNMDDLMKYTMFRKPKPGGAV